MLLLLTKKFAPCSPVQAFRSIQEKEVPLYLHGTPKKKAHFVQITAKHSRLVLAVQGGATVVGTAVIQTAKKTVGHDAQLWKLYLEKGTNQHYIQNKLSKLFLEVKDSSSADFGAIVMGPKTGKANQKWTITKTPDGSLSLHNIASSKVLDVNGASTAEGTALIQYQVKYSGVDNQRFFIDPA